ncbi:hypothetical protein GBAR_LOCUS20366, partial [Geodia barretti]
MQDMKKNCRTETLHQLFNMHTLKIRTVLHLLLFVDFFVLLPFPSFPNIAANSKRTKVKSLHIVRMRSELYRNSLRANAVTRSRMVHRNKNSKHYILPTGNTLGIIVTDRVPYGRGTIRLCCGTAGRHCFLRDSPAECGTVGKYALG